MIGLADAIQCNSKIEVQRIIQDNNNCVLGPNSYDELPLHLASKDDKYKEIVEVLLEKEETRYRQLEAENEIYGNTPLHVAAFLGCRKIVEAIFKKCGNSGTKIKELLKKINKMGDTPVHGAAVKNHLRILEIMYEKDRECITNIGRFQGYPLHSACGYGHTEIVEKLIEWDESPHTTLEKDSVPADLPAFTSTSEHKWDDEDKEQRIIDIELLSAKEEKREKHNHYTPLTRACQLGHHETVEFLLKKGAKRHLLTMIKAIEGLNEECVKLLLLTKPFPEKDLLSPYAHFDAQKNTIVLTTTFRELIKHMPDMAELAIHFGSVKLETFLVNSKSFKIQLDYKFIDDDWKNWEEPTEDYRQPLGFEPENTDSNQKGCINIDFCRDNNTQHPLSLMVKYKQEKLLTHPVVAALINDKWKLEGIYRAACYWLFYIFFMIFVHILILSLPNPSSDLCTQEDDKGENSGSMQSLNTTENCNGTTINNSLIISAAVIILIYSALLFVMKVIQMVIAIITLFQLPCTNDWNVCLYAFFVKVMQAPYIWNLDYWIELTLFLLSFIFSIFVLMIKDENFCLTSMQRQMGAAIIWFSWVEFILLSAQSQLIGVHALMFMNILKSLIKFLPLAFIIIIGFALTFYTLLYDCNLMASPFSTPFYSFMKTLAMTVGDVSADEFFEFKFSCQAQNTSHLELSIIIWILSLFFMTILLSNLMIGLAVGDIQKIVDHALLQKLTLQVNYLIVDRDLSLSHLFTRKILHKCWKQKIDLKEFEPNKQRQLNRETVHKEIIYLVFGGVRYDSQESIERMIKFTRQHNI